MRHHHRLCSAAVALTLLAGTTFAYAQNPKEQVKDEERARQASPPETTTQTPAPPQPVFVDGKLTVPGAPADSETVPAKFSARNDAVDKLNQNALTEKQLNDAQRHALYQRLGPQRETTGSVAPGSGDAGVAPNANIAQVGVVLPTSVKLQALPDDVKQQMPNLALYAYARAAGKVLLVEPNNRAVLAVLGS
jgi:hypothetical protein